MSSYRMTEEFASAMVTVIPIILLLGGAEMLKYTKAYMDVRGPQVTIRAWESLREYLGEDERGEPLLGPPPESAEVPPVAAGFSAVFDRSFALLWGVVAAAHVYMEVRLIQWLAMSDRPKAPLLAERVTWVAGIGFVMLLVGAVLPLVVIRYVATMPYLLRSNGLGRLLRPVIMVMVQPVLKAQARYRAEESEGGAAGGERGAL